jgi:hypothetical protein
MSDPKKGTGKKPKGSGRRLYTDENPKDTVSVKFSTVQDIKDTLSKSSFKSKSHKRQSQIINLIHQRSRAAYQNAKDPKVKARLKKAFDYATERKEASKRKTKRMQKSKNETKDIIMQEVEAMMAEKKKKKAGTESSKESSLRDWFGRKGAKGKKKGWVDCNAPDGKGGYKACGREKGEKRSKYPACRPTPGACKERGKGKSWGKKAKKKTKKENLIMNRDSLKQIVKEELQRAIFKPGLLHHVENGIPVTENIYRAGSPCFFNVIKQARMHYKSGLYEALNDEERDLLENSDLGEWAIVEGKRVPLEFPLFIDEELNEAKKKKKKKDPPLNKPMRNSGGGKKYKVYVRDPKSGNVRTITYGDAKGGLKGGWNSAEARKSFASRHQCEKKKDKTKAGYWACRAHKDFGPGVGRFW